MSAAERGREFTSGAAQPPDTDTDGDFDDFDDVGGVGASVRWAGWSITLGFALMLLEALAMLLIVAQGLSLHRSGPGSFQGDILHRLGIAASRSLGVAQSLTLVVAVVLVSLPELTGRQTPARYRGRRVVSLYGVIVVAILVGIGTAIGVRAELHLDRLQQQPTTGFRRWALATDVVGTLGISLVAFLGALAALPDRVTEPSADSTAVADGDAGDESDAGNGSPGFPDTGGQESPTAGV